MVKHMTIAAKSGPYRMSDLVRLVGLPRETIHFYLKEGLLPKPVKKSRNMAWYSDKHVEILKLTRSLQEEQLLPLKAIKALLKDPDNYPFTPHQRGLIERIRRHHLKGAARTPKRMPRTIESLARQYRVTDQDLGDLRKMGLVRTTNGQHPTTDEAECIQLWGAVRSAGITVERNFSVQDLGFLQTAIDIIFEQEVRIFTERFNDLDESEIEPLLHTLVPAVSRLLAILHERKIASFLEHFEAEQ